MHHGFAYVIAALIAVPFEILFRFTVKNKQTINAFKGKQNGVVVIAPHHSYLDALAMFYASRPTQWTRIIAKADLFDQLGGLFGQVLARLGAIPIKRDSADRSALRRGARMLKNGEFVGIFPEGTRRSKGNVATQLHGGAALIARMGKAAMIPLGFKNIDRIKEKGKPLRLKKITAIYGEPVSVSAFDFLPKEDRLEAATWFVLREAFALTKGITPEEVDMPSLFPNDKDFTPLFEGVDIPRIDPNTLPDYQPESAHRTKKGRQRADLDGEE